MSYSRWADSSWYTYWETSKPASVEGELLAIHYSFDEYFVLTLGEIEADVLSALERIKGLTGASDAEIDELRGYCQQFAADVRES
jgi:hypothetical protein